MLILEKFSPECTVLNFSNFPGGKENLIKHLSQQRVSACKKDHRPLQGAVPLKDSCASLEKSRCQYHFRGLWSPDVSGLSGWSRCSNASLRGFLPKKNQKASFGWAARRRWEGKEETDKFRDRPLPAAGLDFLLLIDRGTLLAFLRKAMWIWGKAEKKERQPQMFHKWWSSATLP